MRIIGGTPLGDQFKLIWHCELCYKPVCYWVDNETLEYAEYERSPWKLVFIKKAKKITIDIPAGVIYINPVEDNPCEVTVTKETELCTS